MKPEVENRQNRTRQEDHSRRAEPPPRPVGGERNRCALYVKCYMQPAFLICAAVLAVAGGSMSIAVRSLGIHFEKYPLPLKKSLDLLSEKALAPYKIVSKGKIENPEILRELGTEDYVQWDLQDLDAAADSLVRRCRLFITYYELPSVVPHVPDECYVGVGFQRQSSGGVTFQVNDNGARKKLQGRYVIFSGTSSGSWRDAAKFPILYLFNTNGVYAASRADVRFTLGKNIRGRYSYFSKIEWKFFNVTALGTEVYPSKEEAVAASNKFLAVILPVLEAEHWPDWPVVDGKD